MSGVIGQPGAQIRDIFPDSRQTGRNRVQPATSGGHDACDSRRFLLNGDERARKGHIKAITQFTGLSPLDTPLGIVMSN
jgi:hypothetical protein